MGNVTLHTSNKQRSYIESLTEPNLVLSTTETKGTDTAKLIL